MKPFDPSKLYTCTACGQEHDTLDTAVDPDYALPKPRMEWESRYSRMDPDGKVRTVWNDATIRCDTCGEVLDLVTEKQFV